MKLAFVSAQPCWIEYFTVVNVKHQWTCSVIIVYITAIWFSNIWESNFCLLTTPFIKNPPLKDCIWSTHSSFFYSEHIHVSSGEKKNIVNEIRVRMQWKIIYQNLFQSEVGGRELREYVRGDMLRIHEREIKIIIISKLYLFHWSDMNYTFSIYMKLNKLSGS